MTSQLIGYGIGFISLVAAIVFPVYKNLNDSLIETKNTIKEEFENVYKLFQDNILDGASYSTGALDVISRIKNLHHTSFFDYLRISKIQFQLTLIIPLVCFLILLSIISIYIGNHHINPEEKSLQLLFTNGLPVIFILFTLTYSGFLHSQNNFLKNTTNKYKQKEY